MAYGINKNVQELSVHPMRMYDIHYLSDQYSVQSSIFSKSNNKIDIQILRASKGIFEFPFCFLSIFIFHENNSDLITACIIQSYCFGFHTEFNVLEQKTI